MAIEAPCASLADLVEASSSSIVAVGTYDSLKIPRFTFRGTGFAVHGGSRIVTNAHVLPKPGDSDANAKLAILIPRARGTPEIRAARQVSSDTEHDIAVVAFDGAALPPLTLDTASSARAGTSVALIGFPLGTGLGFVPVTHRGIVSAVTAIALPPATASQLDAKTLARLRQGTFDVLQLDATAYPGNSGSPLFDVETGSVIGVINMVFIKGTKESAISQPTGITYAIPAKYVVELLTRP